jgi:hypothetical protein
MNSTIRSFVKKEVRVRQNSDSDSGSSIDWNSLRRSSIVSLASSTTSASYAASESSGVAPKNPGYRKISGHDAREKIQPPSTSTANEIVYSLDTTGFFEDEKTAKYLKKNETRGMEDAVRQALDKYDPTRPSHTGLGDMPTTNIILTGAAGGKGDYRLGFEIVGSTHRPLAIMTHGAKGAKYKAIRK